MHISEWNGVGGIRASTPALEHRPTGGDGDTPTKALRTEH